VSIYEERSRQNDELFERLTVALQNVLRGGHQVTVDERGGHPLMLLETAADATAFAVVNGRARAMYHAAYDRYQNLYQERHKEWRERNLSFVLLRDDDTEDLNAFFAQVEANPYFCRKYVLAFSSLSKNPGFSGTAVKRYWAGEPSGGQDQRTEVTSEVGTFAP
jgi:hypothetical protein